MIHAAELGRAKAMVDRPAAALADLGALDGAELEGPSGLPLRSADMHRRIGQKEQARAAYDAAIAATKNDVEKRLLMRREASLR